MDENNQGYADAVVTAQPQKGNNTPSQTKTTDGYGRFRFHLRPGGYEVTTTAFTALEPATAVISLPTAAGPITLSLARKRQIAGHVIDEASQSVAGANITLLALRRPGSLKVEPGSPTLASLTYTTQSEAMGRFGFSALWPGAYALEVEAPGFLPHVETYIPANGQEVIIFLKKNTELAARVMDEGHNPIFLAQVNVKRTDGGGILVQSQETAQTGECRFKNLPLGQYHLSAAHSDFLSSAQSESDVKLVSDHGECTLILRKKGVTVSGQVLEANQRKPIPDFALALRHYEPGQYEGEKIAATVSNPQGEFRFSDVRKGEYLPAEDVSANQKNAFTVFGYPASKHRPKVSVTDTDVNGLELFVIPKAVISGHVYSATHQPVADAKVICNVRQNRSRVQTGADGAYRLTSLPLESNDTEETVSLMGAHPLSGIGYSPEFTYKSGTIMENIDIVLHPGVAVSGTVKNEAGEPIAGALMDLYDYTGTDNVWLEHTDTDGQYQFKGRIPRWNSILLVHAQGYEDEKRTLTYPEETQQAREDFTLRSAPTTGIISGVVTDRNGQPLNGVIVSITSHLENKIISWGTDESGQFSFKGLNQTFSYDLSARMQTSPYLQTKLFALPAQTQDLLVRLWFEPVDVWVKPDLSSLSYHEEKLFLNVFSPEGKTDQTILKEDPIHLISPGDYDFYLEGISGNEKGLSCTGYQKVQITDQTPKRITITIPMRENKESIHVGGFCRYPDGNPVAEPFIYSCRFVGTEGIPFQETNTFHAEKQKEWQGSYGSTLPHAGTYEFVISNSLGQTISRQIFSLDRSMCNIEYQGQKAIVLPDVIFPAKSK